MKAKSLEDADFGLRTEPNRVIKDRGGLGWSIPQIARALVDPENPIKVWVEPHRSEVIEPPGDPFFDFVGELRVAVSVATEKWPFGSIETRVLAVSGEAGELAQVITKGEGDARLKAEALDVAVTAYRAWAKL